MSHECITSQIFFVSICMWCHVRQKAEHTFWQQEEDTACSSAQNEARTQTQHCLLFLQGHANGLYVYKLPLGLTFRLTIQHWFILLSIYINICQYIYIHIYIHILKYIYICIFIYTYIFPSLSLSLLISVYLSPKLSVRPLRTVRQGVVILLH